MNPQSKWRAMRKTTQDENAQGLIEFALLATILFFLFLGTVDFARFLYYDNAVTSAARIGAETASNHCAFASTACATTTTATSDSLVMWESYCEANPYAQLRPRYSDCSAGTTSTWTPTCVTTCTNCTQDICVTPSSRTTDTSVTVAIGYSFKPYTLLMSPFFQEHSCFTGDSTSTNHHTLCAQSVGRVS